MAPTAEINEDQEVLLSNTDNKEPKTYTTTIDKSAAHRGFLQHLAVWIWIGWIFFYAVFLVTLPIQYFYFPTLLTVIVWIMTFSAFMPVDKRCQPKVRAPSFSMATLMYAVRSLTCCKTLSW